MPTKNVSWKSLKDIFFRKSNFYRILPVHHDLEYLNYCLKNKTGTQIWLLVSITHGRVENGDSVIFCAKGLTIASFSFAGNIL